MIEFIGYTASLFIVLSFLIILCIYALLIWWGVLSLLFTVT